MEFIKWNPFAPAFEKAKPKNQVVETQQMVDNAQGMSKEDIEELLYSNQYDNTSFSNTDFSQIFAGKKQRISYYRCMSEFPEINDALDWVSDDAIVADDNGIVAKLTIKNADKMPKKVRERLYGIFEYLRDDVLKFNKNGWKLYNDWLIDSELFLELVMNKKKTNIIGVKKLPPFTMIPLYDSGVVKGYIQDFTDSINYKNYAKIDDTTITFASNQIAYSNFGKYGTSLYDVRGYLQSAIRPYNQYKALQDSLIIHRLVNAPERKVWNIDVGKMPKGKAESYVRGLIQRYKRKDVYDADTGTVNSAQSVKSINQDYWFARQEDGKGTTVDSIGGNMEIGNIEDVNMFKTSLFQVLKLPKSRYEETTTYSSGKMGEVEREEVKFNKFIQRTQTQFSSGIILDPFMTLLKLRGVDEQYLDKDLYAIDFTESNLFADYKELDLLESRFALLGTAKDYMATPETLESGEAMFSKEFVLKHYFNMSDEDKIENERLLEKEKAEIADAMESEDEIDADSEEDADEVEKEVGDTDDGVETKDAPKEKDTEEKASSGSPLAKAQASSEDLEESKSYMLNESLSNFINNYKV